VQKQIYVNRAVQTVKYFIEWSSPELQLKFNFCFCKILFEEIFMLHSAIEINICKREKIAV